MRGNDSDYLIFSPPINYENNRETWLKYDGKQKVLVDRKYYINEKSKTPVLKAYYKNENLTKSTPADILYIDKTEDNYFMLYRGDYNIYCGNKLVHTITVE